MGPDMVVVVPPFRNTQSSILKILEPVFIQTVVTIRTVEIFDERVLHRLALIPRLR